MKKQLMRLLLILVLFALPAQSGMSLGATKIEFDLTLNPGQSQLVTFVVENNESMARHINISNSDWRESIDGAITLFEAGSLDVSNVDWVSFSPKSFTLEPGQREEIQVSVNVPATAASGTTWSALLIDSVPVDNTTEASSPAPLMVRVLQTVTSGSSKQMRLENIELIQSEPVRLGIKIANTGNEVLRDILCEIQIRNTQGDTVRDWVMDPVTILPGDARISEVRDFDNTTNPLAPGTYIALVIVDFGGDHLLASQHLFEVANE